MQTSSEFRGEKCRKALDLVLKSTIRHYTQDKEFNRALGLDLKGIGPGSRWEVQSGSKCDQGIMSVLHVSDTNLIKIILAKGSKR